MNDKRIDETTGERKRFAAAILPPWCRRSPKISDVLPLLYLHGLSGGDFVPALEQFLGSSAGLSGSTVEWNLHGCHDRGSFSGQCCQRRASARPDRRKRRSSG